MIRLLAKEGGVKSFLVLLTLCISSYLPAQKLDVSIYGGPSISLISAQSEIIDGFSLQPGYSLGIQVNYRLQQKLFVGFRSSWNKLRGELLDLTLVAGNSTFVGFDMIEIDALQNLLILRYEISQKAVRPFVQGAVGLLHPINMQTTFLLDGYSIESLQEYRDANGAGFSYQISCGLRIAIGDKRYIFAEGYSSSGSSNWRYLPELSDRFVTENDLRIKPIWFGLNFGMNFSF